MSKELEIKDFVQYGILISGNVMENGEMRFRLSSANSAYIRTETKDKTGWQNSHYHSEQTECFLIEKGEAVLAVIENGQVIIQRFHSGDFFCVDPMVPHNMKLSKNGVVHAVKYGGQPDWRACPELDEHLRK